MKKELIKLLMVFLIMAVIYLITEFLLGGYGRKEAFMLFMSFVGASFYMAFSIKLDEDKE